MTERTHPCAIKGCDKSHKTDQWNTKRAHTEGWFMQRNGDHWCPMHTPAWAADWREKQKNHTI